MRNFKTTYYSKSAPCPVCHGPKDCRLRTPDDGGAPQIHCKRTHHEVGGFHFVGQNTFGFGVHISDYDYEMSERNRQQQDRDLDRRAFSNSKPKSKKDRAARAAAAADTGTTFTLHNYSAGYSQIPQPEIAKSGSDDGKEKAFDLIEKNKKPCNDHQRQFLADQLNLPAEVLYDVEFLKNGFVSVKFKGSDRWERPKAFVITERKSDGTKSYTLRYLNGEKRNHGGRGIVYDDSTFKRTWQPGDYICITEGWSDKKKLESLGFLAIALSNNAHGAEGLAKLLAENNVPAFVSLAFFPDNDAAGQSGANAKIATLKQSVNNLIVKVSPPEGCKDVREFDDPNARQYFVDKIDAALTGPPAPDDEPATASTSSSTPKYEPIAPEFRACNTRPKESPVIVVPEDQFMPRVYGQEDWWEKGKFCTRCKGLKTFLCHDLHRVGGIAFGSPPCQSLRCEACRAMLRNRAIETIQVRFTEFSQEHPDAVFCKFTAYIDGEEGRKKLERELHAKGGRYVLIGDLDRVVVISTVQPNGINFQTFKLEEAIAEATKAVQLIPDEQDEKFFWKCAEWPLLQYDSGRSGRFKRIFGLPPRGLEAYRRIIESFPNIEYRGQFTIPSGMRWEMYQCMDILQNPDAIETLALHLKMGDALRPQNDPCDFSEALGIPRTPVMFEPGSA